MNTRKGMIAFMVTAGGDIDKVSQTVAHFIAEEWMSHDVATDEVAFTEQGERVIKYLQRDLPDLGPR